MKDLISANLEDYLEVILDVLNDKGVVRIRDIALSKDVSMPSVSGALKKLSDLGFVTHDRYEYVELTSKGKRVAGQLAKRHSLLKRFLLDELKVSEETAENDACAIEHCVSNETIDKLLVYLDS